MQESTRETRKADIGERAHQSISPVLPGFRDGMDERGPCATREAPSVIACESTRIPRGTGRKVRGTEKPTWARKRKPETATVESGEIPGRNQRGPTPIMNQSAKGEARSRPHYRGEGVLIHVPYQVCGRHGLEEQRVTSGGLARSSGGTGVTKPISESEGLSRDHPAD
jgi:hypothetical protein